MTVCPGKSVLDITLIHQLRYTNIIVADMKYKWGYLTSAYKLLLVPLFSNFNNN